MELSWLEPARGASPELGAGDDREPVLDGEVPVAEACLEPGEVPEQAALAEDQGEGRAGEEEVPEEVPAPAAVAEPVAVEPAVVAMPPRSRSSSRVAARRGQNAPPDPPPSTSSESSDESGQPNQPPIEEDERDAIPPPLEDQPVNVPSLNVQYPAPSRFDAVHYMDDSREAVALFACAPWFDRAAVYAGDVPWQRYVDDDDELPGMVPLSALQTWAWLRWFCVNPDNLLVSHGCTPAESMARFVRQANCRLSRLWRTSPIPPELGLDMFQYRTNGEREYCRRLAAIPAASIQAWRGQFMVTDDAVCFGKPLVSVDFRFVRKDSAYWRSVRDENRDRRRTGMIIPYQCSGSREMNRAAKRQSFARATVGWTRLESPRGCCVETPPVFSYKTSVLRSRASGHWVVAYTEKVCQTAAFTLGDVYDSLRLWAVSPDCIRFARQLNLLPILGNQVNVDEFHALLDLTEATDFSRYPERQRNRGESAKFCLGRDEPGADYVHFCPVENRIISPEEFVRKRREGRPVRPPGIPPVGISVSRSQAGVKP